MYTRNYLEQLWTDSSVLFVTSRNCCFCAGQLERNNDFFLNQQKSKESIYYLGLGHLLNIDNLLLETITFKIRKIKDTRIHDLTDQ